MKKDLHNNVKIAKARSSAAITTNTTSAGDIIDTHDYQSLEFAILSATITDGTFTPLIEVGNDSGLSDAVTVSSDSNAILGTVALATFVAADDNTVKKIGVRKDGYRYARLSLVSTGVTSGGTLGAIAILSHPVIAPVA